MFTPRYFLLALICPGLLILAGFISPLTGIALIYGIGIGLLGWLDRRYAVTGSQFSIERNHDDKLSLGASNRVAIRLRSFAERPITFWLRDEPPPIFVGAEQGEQRGQLQPRGSTEFELPPSPRACALLFEFRPADRGD